MADIGALKKLALLGATREQILISSSDFAQHISASPQTASRRLQALEREELISRVIIPEGQLVSITQSGKDVLRNEYYEYQKIFEPSENEIE
ncbi:MAG: riboflavin kinase, partial [Methanocellales archaeon]|nr:riboflavin kinase [Methanocellales archaeon]